MREKKDGQQASDLPVYESHPPVWLPKIHGSADLGEHLGGNHSLLYLC